MAHIIFGAVFFSVGINASFISDTFLRNTTMFLKNILSFYLRVSIGVSRDSRIPEFIQTRYFNFRFTDDTVLLAETDHDLCRA